MDPIAIIALVVAALLLLLIMETPVAYALTIVGTLGLILLHDVGYAGSVLGSAPFTQTSAFTLTVIPTFILIGIFAVHGRIAEQVFQICNHLFRRVPGGLGCATVMACAGFAAVTGSSVATAATMARLSIDQMLRYGYPAPFASGLVAASGTLGVMIPPSIILVLYAVITGESTGQMLAAGIVPGLLTASMYIVYVMVRARRVLPEEAAARAAGRRARTAQGAATADGERVAGSGAVAVVDEPLAVGGPDEPPADEVERQRLRDLPWRGAFRVAIIFTIVLGGIYSGIFTATESGAIGALAALVMMVIELRRDGARLIGQRFAAALKEAASTTSMVFAIVVGSSVFSAFLVTSRAPQSLADTIAGLDVPPAVVIIAFLLILLPLGMCLESISILIITMPLMYPVVTDLGYSGVWFGILVVKMVEIGLITPPVGISVFVVAGSTDKVSVEQVFRGVWPFVLMELSLVAFLFLVPDVVLWLPSKAAP